MPRLQIIVASTRPGRTAPAIADWFAKVAKDHGGYDVEVVDLAEAGLPFFDEPNHPSERKYVHQHTKDWSNRIDSGDAYVFVSPEYNGGFAAPLKNALDYLYYEWQHKPAGFISYGMSSAGLRAVQMIKPVLSALKMVPAGEVIIPLRQHLDENGDLHPSDAHDATARALLDDMLELGSALEPLRP